MTVETTRKSESSSASHVQNDVAAPLNGATVTMVPQLLEQLMQIARTSALEEMASGFAHEINQPIGAITTFAQTGERMLGQPTPMVKETRDVLHHISEQALKAGRGIHTIRSLFRGRAVEKARCDLGEVVTELEPVLRFLAERSRVQLSLKIAPGLPPTIIDRLRIQHVIFTLVQNALEALDDSGTTRAVEIEVTGDRYAVTTAVRDYGRGVPAHARDQLFHPFFTTKPNGTGLGLASIRAIVEAHEGTVGFDDAEGGGARFWFRLLADSGAVSQ